MRNLIMAISFLFPWFIRRWILKILLGFELHPTSYIGFAWVLPRRLIMEAHTSIGHLTICKNLDLIHMKEYAVIGRGNWITGFPPIESPHFAHQPDREPQLIMGEHSAITNRHLIDCTSKVTIGKFATFAGFRSQIMTHSVDIEKGRQTSAPVTIGDYSFVGTDCVILGGSTLPSYSVMGAKSLLNKEYEESHHLYAGIPARPVKALPQDYEYFCRETGFIY
jgi:acetyltransferase-like isoleucine patch superfamily enzyme